MTALERQEVLPVHVRTKTLHQAEIHNRRPMHSLELLWGENLLELLHCSTEDMSVSAGVDAHVIASGINPLYGCNGDTHRLAPLADWKDLRTAWFGGLGPVSQKLFARQFSGPSDLCDDFTEPVSLIGGVSRLHLISDAFECRVEPFVVDGVEQIVDGTCLERANSVL